jgi:hypothetical protein
MGRPNGGTRQDDEVSFNQRAGRRLDGVARSLYFVQRLRNVEDDILSLGTDRDESDIAWRKAHKARTWDSER